jgi:hypothetical protein
MHITYRFFVSKAADPWVDVDGLLSWCSFHFKLGRTSFPLQLEVKATPGRKTIHFYPRVRSLRNKKNCNMYFGTPESTLDKSSLVLRLARRWVI